MRFVATAATDISPKISQRTKHIDAFATKVTETVANRFLTALVNTLPRFFEARSNRVESTEYQLTSPKVDKNESQNETEVAEPGMSRISAPATESEVSASESREMAKERYAKSSIRTDLKAEAEKPERKSIRRAIKENNTYLMLL